MSWPFWKPGRAHSLHRLAHALGAFERAYALDLDDGVRREQIDDVVPHLAVDVVAIRVLQVANQVFVVEAIDLLQQRGERLVAA